MTWFSLQQDDDEQRGQRGDRDQAAQIEGQFLCSRVHGVPLYFIRLISDR